MEAKQLYWEIEEIARIKGNSHYIIGDPALYKFEPGTTDVPNELTVNYDEARNLGLVGLKSSNTRFLQDLIKKINSAKHGIIMESCKQDDALINHAIEIDNFGENYTYFANVLKELLKNNRYNIPKLVKAEFKKEENDEYHLSCDNGQLWINRYVCHGAEFGVHIAGYYLADFESPKELLDYAQGLVKMEKGLKKNRFDFTCENERGYFDYRINVKAESEQRIKNDLEKIIEIVRGE